MNYHDSLAELLQRKQAKTESGKAKLRHYDAVQLLALQCQVTQSTIKKHYELIKRNALFDFDMWEIWLK